MLEFVIIGVCIAINGALSAFEMGLVTVKRASLLHLKAEGSGKAALLLRMREQLEKTLSSTQVGITVVALVAGTMTGTIATEIGIPMLLQLGLPTPWCEPVAVALFVVSVTYVTVVLGELLPKAVAAQYPVRAIFFFHRSIVLMTAVFGPFVQLLEASTKLAYRLLEKCGFWAEPSELDAVDEGFAIHRLSKQHRDYVFNLINIQKRPLSEVLLPWREVVTVDYSMPLQEVRKILVESGHTRVPVCRAGQVVGLLNAKEFFANKDAEWQSLIRPIIVVSDLDRPLNILRRMQKKRSHMCLVKSKSRDALGIITIEDIFEQFVGDIYDEDDMPKGVDTNL